MPNEGKPNNIWVSFKDWFNARGKIDFVIGFFGAVFMPILLPTTIKGLFNTGFWGIACILITEFALIVFHLPQNLQDNWDKLPQNLQDKWDKFQESSLTPILNMLCRIHSSHTEWCLSRYILHLRGKILFEDRKVQDYVNLIKDIMSV